MSLETLQRDFQTYLMRSNEAVALPYIAPAEPFNAKQRMNVYHYAYRARLQEVLAEDFAKCVALLGDEDFERAALRYLDTYPSHHFSVRYFGQYFAQFLSHTDPYRKFPVLAEMARFELASHYTLDAKDAPLLMREDLASIAPDAWPDVVFHFHPSVRIERFEWDTVAIWKEIEEAKEPRDPKKLDAPITWLLWRNDLMCFFGSLTPAQVIMAEHIQNNANFSEICESLCEILPEAEVPVIAMETIAGWLVGGVLAKN